MASEMVEKVRSALSDVLMKDGVDLDAMARAAIAAMREVFTEPSETVQDAALPYAEPIRAALAAQAMIDAALKEEPAEEISADDWRYRHLTTDGRI